MSISYTQEYEQLLIFDFKSDKSNLETVSKLLTEVSNDVLRVQEFILSKIERFENLKDIMDKLHFIEKEKIVLTNYPNTRELQNVLHAIEEQKVSYNDIITNRDSVLIFYEKISPCRYIDGQLLRIMKREGFELQAKILRELHHIATKPILKYLLELYDIYNDLLDIQEDLEAKRNKFEHKLDDGQHKYLFEAIQQSKQNHRRDTLLLVQGLLKTDGKFYHSLKRQLDDQYDKIIQTKLFQLNQLVNNYERVYIDEREVMIQLKEFRRKYLRLQRYVLM